MAGDGRKYSGSDMAIRRSAQLVSEAMDVLDAHGGPAEAAAHLALALQELRDHLIRSNE